MEASLGQKIKSVREAMGLERFDLSKRLSCSWTAIQYYEFDIVEPPLVFIAALGRLVEEGRKGTNDGNIDRQ